jgi:hypothetical protein
VGGEPVPSFWLLALLALAQVQEQEEVLELVQVQVLPSLPSWVHTHRLDPSHKTLWEEIGGCQHVSGME